MPRSSSSNFEVGRSAVRRLEPDMASASNVKAPSTVYISHYDRRVRLVADALTQNSKLTDDAAVELAKHVLDALDHIPEKLR
jgi:Family of unknown function (DUF6307)